MTNGEGYSVMKRFYAPLLLCALVAASALSSAMAADTSSKRDEVIYDACMQVYPKELKDKGEKEPEKVAHYVCLIIAGDCRDNPGGDSCRKTLRDLDKKLSTSGQSIVYMAAYAGRTDLVKTMIDLGADMNRPVVGIGSSIYGEGWVPLMIAAAEGYATTVSTLIQAGADVNAKNNRGRTALMFAASYGYTAIAKDLLTHGADPNIVPRDGTGWTALIAAAHKGSIDTVKVLLDHAADVSIKDKDGKTALMWAEERGHSEVARILREAGLK